MDDQRTSTKNKKPDVKMCLPDIQESEIQDEGKTEMKKGNRKRRKQNIFNVFLDYDASQGVNLSTTNIQSTDFFSVKHIQFIVKTHSRIECVLRINWMCLTEKNVHFVSIQEHIGMTNVKHNQVQLYCCIFTSYSGFESRSIDHLG